MGNYPTLPYLNANDQTVSMSGIGAGCAMAQEYAVIYSSDISALALFMCWPYGVTYGDIDDNILNEDQLYE